MPDLIPTIDTNAQNPQSAKTAAGEVTQNKLTDIIAADVYTKGATAASTVNRGLRFGKFIPTGPAPDQQATNGPGQGFASGGIF